MCVRVSRCESDEGMMHVSVMRMIRVRMMRMMRVRVSENDATVDCTVSRIFQEIKVLFFWRVFLLQIRSEIVKFWKLDPRIFGLKVKYLSCQSGRSSKG